MQEVSFSIPVSGIIRIGEDNSITITVNKAETTINFEPVRRKDERISLAKGQTMFDILLNTARRLVASNAETRFTAAELYHEAIRKYPTLKRNSWISHVIASAPDHPSHKHHNARRDYLNYIGEGTYKLNPKYVTAHDNDV